MKRNKTAVILKSLWNSCFGILCIILGIFMFIGLGILNGYTEHKICRSKTIICNNTEFSFENRTERNIMLEKSECKSICDSIDNFALAAFQSLVIIIAIFFIWMFYELCSTTKGQLNTAKRNGKSQYNEFFSTPCAYFLYSILGALFITLLLIFIGYINLFLMKIGLLPCIKDDKICRIDLGIGLLWCFIESIIGLVILLIYIGCSETIGDTREKLKKDLSNYDMEKQTEINKRMS